MHKSQTPNEGQKLDPPKNLERNNAPANVSELPQEGVGIIGRIREKIATTIPETVKDAYAYTKERIAQAGEYLRSRIPQQYQPAFQTAFETLKNIKYAPYSLPFLLIPLESAHGVTLEEIERENGITGATRTATGSWLDQAIDKAAAGGNFVSNEAWLLAATGLIGGTAGWINATGRFSLDDAVKYALGFAGGELAIRHGLGIDPGYWASAIIAFAIAGGTVGWRKLNG